MCAATSAGAVFAAQFAGPKKFVVVCLVLISISRSTIMGTTGVRNILKDAAAAFQYERSTAGRPNGTPNFYGFSFAI